MKKLLLSLIFMLSVFPCFTQDRIKGFTKIHTDEFTGVNTFVLWNSILCFTGMDVRVKTGGDIALPRMYVNFTCISTEWVFFDKIIIKYKKDGKVKSTEITFNPADKHQDVGDYYGGVCCEYVLVLVDVDLLNTLSELTESTDIILRYEGKGGYRNRDTFPKRYLSSLKKAIEWYVSILSNAEKTAIQTKNSISLKS